ncbi:MAG: glycosyltransferase family 1 protein [Clostridia bacterium]|nr:glycosyltransferase family 1 protein [Clostridia bacterium]
MIIIYEPQCIGFEHVEFNASFITVVSYAYPNEKILFLAEETHLQEVSKKLASQSIGGVEYRVIVLPPRHMSSFRKLPGEYRLCRYVFELARKYHANKVVFSSITSPSLISIKMLLRKFKEINCIVIPHRILETLVVRPSLRQPLEIVFWFRFPLLLGSSDRITYLVLGQSIQKCLCSKFPTIEKKIKSIDLPYFYQDPKEFLPFKDKVIRFGSFGVGHRGKGTDLFFKLADEVQANKTVYQPEFILIGHLNDKALRHAYPASVLVPSPSTPLSREDFDMFAQNVDYAVFLHLPKTYKLVASGALFDAFSYVKPIIALRNPFFEYYFQTMGDIGYLCESYDEIHAVILNVLRDGSTERYIRQRENIILGRKQITVDKLGEKLRRIISEND